MRKHLHGFTLIELLVVITIIVVLLALLTPALDRAIMQAELAACGANESAVARGMVAYATEQRRTYPRRPSMEYWARRRPNIIQDNYEGVWDDRPYLAMAMGGSLDVLLDPFGLEIDLANENSTAIIESHYSLWHHFQYEPSLGGGAPMKHYGDAVRWTDTSRGRNVRHRFSVLISDWDQAYPTGGSFKSIHSHPDDRQLLFRYAVDDGSWMEAAYTSHDTAERGATDMNFGLDDGSVLRVGDVQWNDERMAHVPYNFYGELWTTDPATSLRLQLPMQQ